MVLIRHCTILLFAGLLCASPLLRAQAVLSLRSGLIYAIQGDVEVDGKKPHLDPPNAYPQLNDRQPIITTSGRAEILLNSQSVLWMGRDSRLYFEDTALESTLAVLEQGTVMVEIRDVLDGTRIEVQAGEETVTLEEKGLYRIKYDAADDAGKVQVLGGRALLTSKESSLPTEVTRERELALPYTGENRPAKMASLNMDGLHWWASFRSLQIDWENRRRGPRSWQGRVYSEHPYFDVRYENNQGSAAIEYLNYQKAGVMFFHSGQVQVNGRSPRHYIHPLSPYLPDEAEVETGRGRAEIFLGAGVTARLDRDSRFQMVDSDVEHPAVALEHGAMILEVAKTGEDSGVQIRVGDTTTTIHKNGLYRFDADDPALKVWGGETSTIAENGQRIRTRSGRTLDLASLAEPEKFDRTEAQDSLFKWSAERSFLLFTIANNTMVDWTQGTFMNRAMHDFYEERAFARRRGGRRRLDANTYMFNF